MLFRDFIGSVVEVQPHHLKNIVMAHTKKSRSSVKFKLPERFLVYIPLGNKLLQFFMEFFRVRPRMTTTRLGFYVFKAFSLKGKQSFAEFV